MSKIYANNLVLTDTVITIYLSCIYIYQKNIKSGVVSPKIFS